MQEAIGEDGCPIFKASISLDLADQDKTFKWGVVLDGPQGSNFWGIPTEVQDVNSVERYRQFRLTGGGSASSRTLLLHLRPSLGSQQTLRGRKRRRRACVLPFGRPTRKASTWSSESRRNGYIANDGTGIDPAQPVVALSRSADGIWEGGPPGDFEHFQKPALHVSHRERARADRLSHRYFFPQPNRQRRHQSGPRTALGRERWTPWTAP